MKGVHKNSVTDRVSRLAEGEKMYIETTPEEYAHTQSTYLLPQSRRPKEMKGWHLSAKLFTAVAAAKVGEIRYLVCIERHAVPTPLKLETDSYCIEVEPDKLHGYFEHNEEGDNQAGELLFERGPTPVLAASLPGGRLRLIDYDGVFEWPKEVIDALKGIGVDVSNVED